MYISSFQVRGKGCRQGVDQCFERNSRRFRFFETKKKNYTLSGKKLVFYARIYRSLERFVKCKYVDLMQKIRKQIFFQSNCIPLI